MFLVSKRLNPIAAVSCFPLKRAACSSVLPAHTLCETKRCRATRLTQYQSVPSENESGGYNLSPRLETRDQGLDCQ